MAELLKEREVSIAWAQTNVQDDLLAGAIWECGHCQPSEVQGPEDLPATPITWMPATVPGTAAGALDAAGRAGSDLDAEDWLFRTTLVADAGPARLLIGGIATVADVWLGDQQLLHSENMFRSYSLDVELDAGENELLIRCAALNPLLAQRRRRPRWKSYLVANQNLRWFRTSLLGRIPGWAVTPPAVGPWRPLQLLPAGAVVSDDWRLGTSCDGDTGIVDVEIKLPRALGQSADATVSAHGASARLQQIQDGDEHLLRGQLRIPQIDRWWPNTHGGQSRYEVALSVDGQTRSLGQVGFRTVEIDRTDGAFTVIVNGQPIFCRGACWLPPDPVNFATDSSTQRRWLEQARDANMNMVRVPGTTVYPNREFYEACDELGLLVWQDCMFAFLDPPDGDEAFVEEVTAELTQAFALLCGHPSVAVVCGNQEVEEVAAMNGLPQTGWQTVLTDRLIPELLAQLLPGMAYISSNPTGGTLPFQMDHGVSQYFGVGGYMRPLDDARRAGVRFASECLALATPPDPVTVDERCGGASAANHDPSWKQAVHHDSGRSWDMEDVRDFYMRAIFDVDPLHERYVDAERALDLGRATNAEMVRSVFNEWRRPGSSCDGGLVLALGDLRAGAGWGVVDSVGRPKAPWYTLRRAFQPVALLLTDEGLNGLDLHLINDRPETFHGRLELELFARGETRVDGGGQEVRITAHGASTIQSAGLLDGFRDISYAYRFSPPTHDLVVATLYDDTDAVVSQIVHLPLGQRRSLEVDLGLSATFGRDDTGEWFVTLSTRRFAQWLSLDVPGYLPEDSWFHLPPGSSRTIALRPDPAGESLQRSEPSYGYVRALNLDTPVMITDAELAP